MIPRLAALPSCAVALAVALAVGGVSACTTQTRASDANASSAQDANAHVGAGAASAGNTNSAPVDADANVGAGAASDGGSSTGAASADALGGGADAPAKDAAGARATSTSGPAAPGKSTPFDRILVKPKVAAGDIEVLQALIESTTAHKLALVRRTAGKWLLLQFTPTATGRDENDQRALVEVLKSMDAFSLVEGDRLLQVKQP